MKKQQQLNIQTDNGENAPEVFSGNLLYFDLLSQLTVIKTNLFNGYLEVSWNPQDVNKSHLETENGKAYLIIKNGAVTDVILNRIPDNYLVHNSASEDNVIDRLKGVLQICYMIGAEHPLDIRSAFYKTSYFDTSTSAMSFEPHDLNGMLMDLESADFPEIIEQQQI